MDLRKSHGLEVGSPLAYAHVGDFVGWIVLGTLAVPMPRLAHQALSHVKSDTNDSDLFPLSIIGTPQRQDTPQSPANTPKGSFGIQMNPRLPSNADPLATPY